MKGIDRVAERDSRDGTNVEIQSLRVEYGTGNAETVLAVDDVGISVSGGEFACLLGPSGCGKTTVLNCIAGFVEPTSGTVTVDDEPVTGPNPEVGIVFQEHGLFPWETVLGNVEFGPSVQGEDRKERKKRIRSLIGMVGLTGFENSYPHELSGGMRQRVGIARALANRPNVLLMDEPFGALDAFTREAMQDELLRIWSSETKTVVFVTHDIGEALYLADTVVVMSSRPGRVVETVSVEASRPRDRTADEIVDAYKRIEDLVKGEEHTR